MLQQKYMHGHVLEWPAIVAFQPFAIIALKSQHTVLQHHQTVDWAKETGAEQDARIWAALMQ